MELFALITLNIAFGMGLYILLSGKMNRTLKESQGIQLEKKVRAVYSQFIQDSNQSMELLDAKKRGLRDLIQRSERILELLQEEKDIGQGLSIQLQNLLNQSKDIISKTENKFSESKIDHLTEELPRPRHTLTPTSYETLHTNSISKVSLYKENKKENLSNLEPIRDSAPNLLAMLGQKVRSTMGMQEINLPQSASIRSGMGIEINAERPSSSKKLAYTIEGDVFSDDDSGIIDEEQRKLTEEGSFLSTLKEVSSPHKEKDRVTITPESLLAELPPSATKIDKVVHLLKKGYTHDEVSDALDIGTREISLIETVRLQNARRV